MGGLGTLVGGAVLGLGSARMSQKTVEHTSASSVHEAMTPSMPEPPALPGAGESPEGTTGNEGMEAERERERREAALRRQRGGDLFTSGLGASGLADTSKKSLLGG